MKIKKKHKYNAIIYTPVNVVLHILPYASFLTNNIFLPFMFTVTRRKTLILTCAFKGLVTPVTFDYVSYKKKLLSFQLSSANLNAVVFCFRFFLITELKKI